MTTAKNAFAEALVAFQAEMPKINKGKTATVPTKSGGSYRYTYADLADVTDAAIPVLGAHGFAFTSQPSRCENGDYELVGELLHTSGESRSGSLPLIGRTAQEIGGSITYARRYLLGCMTGIVTDDDVDAQDRSTQRTAQPTALEVAQQRVAQSYAMLFKRPANFPNMAEQYLSDHDRDLTKASVEELNSWADELDARRAANGAQAASAAAISGLGAVASGE